MVLVDRHLKPKDKKQETGGGAKYKGNTDRVMLGETTKGNKAKRNAAEFAMPCHAIQNRKFFPI